MRSHDSVTPWIVLPLAGCGLLGLCVVASARLLPPPTVRSDAPPVAPVVVSEAPAPPRATEPSVRRSAKPPRAPRVIPAEVPLVLRGTLCARDPVLSLAAVEQLEDGRTRTLQLGDLVEGAEVVAIERTRVLFRRASRDGAGPDGQLEELVLGARPARPSPRPAQRGAAELRPPRADVGIRQRAPGEFEVSRQGLERFAQGADDRILREVQVLPAMEGGRTTGFRFTRVAQGSLADALGLRQGDVVQRVNGMALDSPEKVLHLYSQLREARRIDLDIARGGGTTRLTYHLDGT